MKSIKLLGLIACCLISALCLFAFISRNKIIPKQNFTNTDGKGIAVLELFTSEGCSSCSPADELLAQIQREAEGKAVYILAYHVDYWNRLGWKDIFSSADFSKGRRNTVAGSDLKFTRRN